jgi:hypothetical protein
MPEQGVAACVKQDTPGLQGVVTPAVGCCPAGKELPDSAVEVCAAIDQWLYTVLAASAVDRPSPK